MTINYSYKCRFEAIIKTRPTVNQSICAVYYDDMLYDHSALWYDSCVVTFPDKLCDKLIKHNIYVLTFSCQLTNITHQTNIIDHSKYTIHNIL